MKQAKILKAIMLKNTFTWVSIYLSVVYPSYAERTVVRIDGGGLGTIVTPTPTDIGTDNKGTEYRITGGLQGGRNSSGTNLFHNFNNFSINKYDTALFLNNYQLGETNIIALVTGNNSSFIGGTIKTEGYDQGVNLFVLNPSGVIFTENAALEINGSFHVSTANMLKFGEDVDLLVNSPSQVKLIAAPLSAFGFFENPSEITIDSSSLEVKEGEAISVIAENINISNGEIIASSGRINLVGIGAQGNIGFNHENNSIDLKNQMHGNITLDNAYISISVRDNSFISNVNEVGISLFSKDISMSGGNILSTGVALGKIQLDAEVIDINSGNNGAVIRTTTGDADKKAGDIQVSATESFRIDGKESKEGAIISSSATGHGATGGNIIITSPRIYLDGAKIRAISAGEGKAGGVILDVSEHLQLSNKASISVNILEGDNQNPGGNIDIGQGLISYGQQNNIQFEQATKFVTLTDSSSIKGEATQGQGGHISIKTKHLLRSTDSTISTRSSGNIDGTIEVTSPISNVVPGTVQLPQSYLTAIELSGNPCVTRTSSNGNSLIVQESSGIAHEPSSMLSANGSNQYDSLPPVSIQSINNTLILSELECKK